MTVFVLDNSVTMRWFFDSGSHPYADALLQRLMASTDAAIVPTLWAYEASSVIARAQLKNSATAQEAGKFFNALSLLPITIDDQSARHIFSDVHRLAVAHRLTSYDAAYLELALRRQLPLATLDAELIAACARAGVPVK